MVFERIAASWVWDAEQARNGDKGQLLRQQTGPFLQAAGDDHAVVSWQHGVAGEDVGLGLRVRTDLPRQG